VGQNRERVVAAFRQRVLKEYGPQMSDVIFDWTSLVYFGYKPELAMRRNSKDGHPEECQMTVGVAQAAKPLCIPLGLTVMPGNTHDSKHMGRTYDQVKNDLNMAARVKKADKLYREAVSLQADLDKGKKLKKRYQIGNDLIEARIYLQTKLTHMADQETRDYILERTMDGREGFFCLTSNLDLNISTTASAIDCILKAFPQSRVFYRISSWNSEKPRKMRSAVSSKPWASTL
jgi:hypothetical protein